MKEYHRGMGLIAVFDASYCFKIERHLLDYFVKFSTAVLNFNDIGGIMISRGTEH